MLDFLDSLIILAAAYLALATACSYINEQISAALHWRGQTLYEGVLNLLCVAKEFADAIYQHPLVASGSRDKNGTIATESRTWNDPNYRPSYIAARSFTVAFLQTMMGAAKGEDAKNTTDNHDVQSNPKIVLDAAANVPLARNEILASLSLKLAPAKKEGDIAGPLVGTDLGKQLASLLMEAQNDYDKLLAATDKLFNDQMDRVSGWYRRKTQVVLFVISVVITVLLNIDTVQIVASLQAQPEVRSQLAQGIVKAMASPSASGSRSTALPPTPSGMDVSQCTPGANSTPSPSPYIGRLDRACVVARTIDQYATGQFASIFIGPPIWQWWKDARDGNGFHFDAVRLLGLLITAMAAALGAPFWFDALCGLLNINARLAGVKPKPQTPS